MITDKKTMTVEELRMVMIEGTSRVWTSAFEAAVRNEILAEFEEVALEFQKDTREYNPTIVNETLLACSNRIWNLIESIKNEKGGQQ